MGQSLAKLKLVLEIDGDKVVVNGVEKVDAAVGKLAANTQAATGRMTGGMGDVSAATGQMAGEITTAFGRMTVGLTAAYLGFQATKQAAEAVFDVIKKGINVVDDFALSTIQIAGQITQMQGPKDVAKHYQEASVYAGALALKLQEMDANSLANSKGLMAMTQTMTMQGVLLDVNNRKQVEAATALSNAIASYTKGQDQQLQFYQETRSLMSGQIDMHSQVSRAIDQAIKQEGKYKDGLKEVVELGKQHGDLLERLQPYLTGINAATEDINKTWTAATSSMETTVSIITRAGFGEVYRDAVGWLQQANGYLRDHSKEIGGGIQQGWQVTKGLIEGSVTALQAGGVVLNTTIIPAFSDAHYLVKGTAETIGTIVYVLQSAPGLLVPVGVAAYYAVGGIAAITVAYGALTTTIEASMATNPIGWIALGIIAVEQAAKPAVKYLDELLSKYAQLNLTGEAMYNAEKKRAADADKAWEDEKKRQRFMYEDGGRTISPGMMKELGIVTAPKIPPAPKEVDQALLDEQFKRNEGVTKYWNSVQDHLRTTAPWLEKFEQGMEKINVDYDNQIKLLAKADPLYTKQVADLDRTKEQLTERLRMEKAYKDEADSSKEMDKLRNDYLKHEEAQRLKNQKEALELSKLQIATDLSAVDAAEKFYQITAGDAAQLRIGLLQKSIKLEQEQYSKIKGDLPEQEILRLKILKVIADQNIKLLEQQRILRDSTALGGATAALQEYIRAANDVGAQTKALTNDALKGLEDGLVRAAQTGRISFHDMAKSIEADLLRIAARNVIAGGANGVLTIVTSSDQNSWFGKLMTGLTSAVGLNTLATEKNTAAQAGSGIGGSAGGAAGGVASTGLIGLIVAGVVAGIWGSNREFKSGGEWNRRSEDQRWRMLGNESAINIPSGGAGSGILNTVDLITRGRLYGTGWRQTSAGMELGVANGQMYGNQYIETQRRRSLFGGTATSGNQSELDGLWRNLIDSQFQSIKDAIAFSASGRGVSQAMVEQLMNNFTSATTRLNLQGKSAEEQKKAIEEYFRTLGNEALAAAYPSLQSMQRAGEDLTATFERVEELRLRNNSLLMQELELMGRAGSPDYLQLLNNQRQAELAGMDASTRAIQRRIWTLEDERAAIQRANEVADANAALTIRALQVNNDPAASLRGLEQQQLVERRDAIEKGLVDITRLEAVQVQERNNLIRDIMEQANSDLAAAQRNYADVMRTSLSGVADSLSEASAALQQTVGDLRGQLLAETDLQMSYVAAIRNITGGLGAQLSPEAAYNNARATFANAADKDLPAAAEAFMAASKEYNATGAAFFADQHMVLARLGAVSGLGQSPTLAAAEEQTRKLEAIRSLIESGNQVQLQQLQSLLTGVLTSGQIQAVNLGDVVSSMRTSALEQVQVMSSLVSSSSATNSLLTTYISNAISANAAAAAAATAQAAAQAEANRLAQESAAAQLRAAQEAAARAEAARQAGILGDIVTRVSQIVPAASHISDPSGTYSAINSQLVPLMSSYTGSITDPGLREQLTIINSFLSKYYGASLPAFDVGSPYIPYDMTANIHEGEMVVDRASANALRKYGVPVTGSADNRETVAELKEQNRLLRELLVEARANVRVNQAGHSGTIQGIEKVADSQSTLARKARLAAAA